MRKTVDLSNNYAKRRKSAQGSLYLSAKSYFDQIIGSHSTSIRPPADLDRVWCTLHSSVDVDNVASRPFRVIFEYLRNIVNKEDNLRKWQPIEILLRFIPELVSGPTNWPTIIWRKRKRKRFGTGSLTRVTVCHATRRSMEFHL